LGGIERQGAAGFSIGNKGYIGTGIHYIGTGNYTFLNDFWQYDPITDIWTQEANTGGLGRAYATGFSIGTMGYFGTGNNSTENGGQLKDFLEYNPETNAWNQEATFTQIPRDFCIGFSIGTKGYLGTGVVGTSTCVQDFWEYDQTANTWTQKTDLGNTHKGALKDAIIGGTDQVNNEELNVYPNPSSSTFNFRLQTTSKDPVNVKIFDMTERLVHEYHSLSADDVITIGDNLNAGMYMAIVTQGEYRKTVKITKVN
jgi:N-acetylneuraminic acid mutarotase